MTWIYEFRLPELVCNGVSGVFSNEHTSKKLLLEAGVLCTSTGIFQIDVRVG